MGIELVELDELLERSDVITLHVVKTSETTHLIGEAELDRAKPGALIVNVSRGGVVDEDALARAIEAGRSAVQRSTCSSTSRRPASPLFDSSGW